MTSSLLTHGHRAELRRRGCGNCGARVFAYSDAPGAVWSYCGNNPSCLRHMQGAESWWLGLIYQTAPELFTTTMKFPK